MLNKILNNLKEGIVEAIKQLGYYNEDIIKSKDDIVLEIPKEKSFGDFATNAAMRLAKVAHKAPIMIANEIKDLLDKDKLHLSNITTANPGFINFTLDAKYLLNVVNDINEQKENYGNSNIGNGQKICLEYVSANPTGYLHVGHGRGAAYGDSLANTMEKAGYSVNREHYVNDAGNQITNMAKSVYARYMELYGYPLELPEDGYHGKEIITVAELFRDEYQDKYVNNFDLQLFRKYGTEKLLNNLKKDLKAFNVEFNTWFSETSLYEAGAVENVLKYLKDNDFTYEQENATWLKTSMYTDEKDRVIVKSDGSYTYLLPDIAYHSNKLSRGYDHLIDVLGADHHGYIDRLKAAVSMVGGNANLIDVEILQMVRVIENGEEVKMSKRSGKAITLSDLVEDVGSDALRYFYVDKALSTHMDLDLTLMKEQSSNNPVYYSQYAHARICGVFEKYKNMGKTYVQTSSFDKVNAEIVKDLCIELSLFKSIVEEVATKRNVHKITHYIYELAGLLHAFYNDEKIITEDDEETNQKLTILNAVRIVLNEALRLVGVNAPEKLTK